MHVAIDDPTRLAYVEVLTDEKASTAVGFLRRAIAFYAGYGVTVERVMTDNGSPLLSTSTPSPAASSGCATSHPPLPPQTNGKAERFIHTLQPTGPTARLPLKRRRTAALALA